MKILNLISLVSFLLAGSVSAQNGTIRGKIIDDTSGEELIGVTVLIKGTTNGAITDLDGAFALSVAPGTYDLQVSYVSFETISITGLEVQSSQVVNIDQVRLKEEVSQLEEVVVTAQIIKQSEAAILTVKRKSANLLDGISAQSFREIGDSDAAAAVKRVTGVSVQDGKYVYVRGLGDRYTKSMLNGMDIPGLDPDRNNLQMDIFPTNVLSNIIVYKSFTPDLPADFTGGVVNIETKDFPAEKTFDVSAGVGFNPSMHFNSDYLTYEGSGTDWLGQDDGTRSLKVHPLVQVPNPVLDNPLTTQVARAFNKTLAAEKKTSTPNFSLSSGLGNQFDVKGLTVGYNAAFSYRKNTTFYDQAENNSYVKPDLGNEFELLLNRPQNGSQSADSRLISGMFGGAVKTAGSKFKVNLLKIQNGETRAGIFNVGSRISGSWDGIKHNLEYTERSLTNLLVGGEYSLNENNWNIKWNVSPTWSKIEDKDVRNTPFRTDGGGFEIEPSESGDPTRIWRNLDESNIVGRFDITKKINVLNGDGKLKFGSYITAKERDYQIFNYRLVLRDPNGNIQLTGDPNQLLLEENIWTVDSDQGSYLFGNFEVSNTFNSRQTNVAVYVQSELQISTKSKAIVGVRVEDYKQFYTGVDQSGTSFDDEEIISSTKFFPSLNLTHSTNERTNIRASYSRTIARPSFKEASIAQIFDPLTGRTFIGGLRPFVVSGDTIWNGGLQETDIDNFDIRYETFQNGGQTVSLSFFYKKFQNPLELVVFSESAPDNFQPRNLGDAKVYGIEFEIRKRLGVIAPNLNNFMFSLNTSLIKSALEMDKSAGGEYESRLNNLRDGETIEDTRPMQGQAPYLINAGVNYAPFDSDWEGGLYYNVQGRRISIVGIGAAADVYDVPFHSLNFSIKKEFGKQKNQQLSFQVNNILDSERRREYESFGSSNATFSLLNPGRTFNLKYRMSLFAQ
ncbi:MAG: TonB-dependent receptor [Cyclobacteriaceae bacterium]